MSVPFRTAPVEMFQRSFAKKHAKFKKGKKQIRNTHPHATVVTLTPSSAMTFAGVRCSFPFWFSRCVPRSPSPSPSFSFLSEPKVNKLPPHVTAPHSDTEYPHTEKRARSPRISQLGKHRDVGNRSRSSSCGIPERNICVVRVRPSEGLRRTEQDDDAALMLHVEHRHHRVRDRRRRA